jgi:hypothetical protein
METVRAVVEIDGKKVVFNGQQFDAAIDYRNTLKGVLHELPESKIFPTRYGDLQVSGTADILHGLIIRDVKTRFSTLKQQEYMDSFQWRIYLSLFEMSNFAYDVFEFKSYDDSQGTNVTGNAFAAHPTIECAGYSSMEADITALLNDFMEYIKFRELDEYISAPAKKYM